MTPGFLCGYLFDLCREGDVVNPLVLESFEEWRDLKLADKPESISDNSHLHSLYEISNPSTSPSTFKILFLSDLDIDANYISGSTSVNCYDPSCCHIDTPNFSESDQAPEFGSFKCNMPLEGHKKMMETINKLNYTSYLSVSSIILGGNTVAYDPVYHD